MKRQWHLESQYIHQTPIIKWDHVGKYAGVISNSFIQGNEILGMEPQVFVSAFLSCSLFNYLVAY